MNVAALVGSDARAAVWLFSGFKDARTCAKYMSLN